MARYTGPVCRMCRREKEKLFLKGEKCYSDKCPITKGAKVPGQHGASRKKATGYGIQFREKQKVRRYYGILEKQFELYFDIATKKEGVTGDNLLRLCESRLDNVVYRLGFAMSRAEAKQLINHGHFLVNGKKVDIPSYILEVGDVIDIKESSKESTKIKAVLAANDQKPIPSWLDLDKNTYTGRVADRPDPAGIDLPIEVHLIVELYSK